MKHFRLLSGGLPSNLNDPIILMIGSFKLDSSRMALNDCNTVYVSGKVVFTSLSLNMVIWSPSHLRRNLEGINRSCVRGVVVLTAIDACRIAVFEK